MANITKGMLARSSPAGLAWYYSDGAWLMAPHLKLLSQKIVAVATGRIPRLIVTMPPRHGKSELISRFTPAWFLGNYPDKKVILASYSDTFAAQWGRAARDVLEEVGQQLFNVTVNQEAKGGALWELNPQPGKRVLRAGVMATAGVGGGITGKGANLMIIDDPVKNSEDAQSAVIRQKQFDWWLSTARTRLQPGAGVILVMTRWHEDDLAGRFLKSEDEHWEILNFPAICEKPGEEPLPDGMIDTRDKWRDELGRKPGDPLWPEMYPIDVLKTTRKAMGNYWFGSMYQQRPAPAEGNLFKSKNFRYYDRDVGSRIVTLHKDDESVAFDPGYGLTFQTVDCAGSSKQGSDFTVVSTWCVTPDHDLIWLNMEDVQFESLDVGGFVDRKFREWKPLIVGVERLGFGLTVIQELVRKGLPIVRLEPNLDKVSRALPAVARTEEHRIYLPKDAEWVARAKKQLLGFPNTTNDDIVDTVSYAALMLPDLNPTTGKGAAQKDNGNTMLANAMSMQL